MLKKIIIRGLYGFPLGLSIGYTFTIITSLIWEDGYYVPCMPELVELVGSEIGAVIVQALLCGLLGGGCAGCSVIWDLETCQTDRYLLSAHHRFDDANRLYHLLDGAQSDGHCKVFWHVRM